MKRKLSPLVWALALLPACARTAPESQWPPPGPSSLPFIPLPEEGFADSDAEGASSAEPAPEPAGPSSIDGKLPDAPPTALARSHQCAQKVCALGKLLPDVAFAKGTPSGGDAPGALWLEDVAAGSSVTLPRDHRVEVLGVLLSGDAVVRGDEGSPALKLGRWSAFRAPGAGLVLEAGSEGAKLVLGVAVANGTLADAMADLEKKAWEVRWKKRPSPLAQVSLADAKDLAWGGGAYHVRLAFGDATPIPGSLGTLSMSPDGGVKEHSHDSWEHIAILEGAGSMNVEGKGYEVKAGSVFDLAPGEKHSFTPAKTAPLLAVQMYTPSGAEQRFVKLAEAAAKAAETPKK
jgi:mannose-6-phosphate isomerase-like protein (cupin superfamily)